MDKTLIIINCFNKLIHNHLNKYLLKKKIEQ